MSENWEEIQISEEINQKLEAALADLKEKGRTLKDGKPIKEVNDVITYMLDCHDALESMDEDDKDTKKPKTPEPPKRKEGWQRPPPSRKFHYYVEGRSLCGGWGFPDYSNLDADTGNKEAYEEDCVSCFRKLVKRRKALGVEKIE